MSNSISVIIPTQFKPGRLYKTLKSLEIQSHAPKEVLVVANSLSPSNENKTPRDFKSFALPLKIISSPNGGNAARNMGLKAATSDIAVLLDDDCELADSHFLKDLLNAHRDHQSFTGIGGVYLSRSDMNLWDRAYNITCNLWASQTCKNSSPALGGVCSYKMSDLKNRNLFPNSASMGGEELHALNQLTAQSLSQCTEPLLAVFHEPKLSFRSFLERAQRHAKPLLHDNPKLRIRPQTLIRQGMQHLRQQPFAMLAATVYIFKLKTIRIWYRWLKSHEPKRSITLQK